MAAGAKESKWAFNHCINTIKFEYYSSGGQTRDAVKSNRRKKSIQGHVQLVIMSNDGETKQRYTLGDVNTMQGAIRTHLSASFHRLRQCLRVPELCPPNQKNDRVQVEWQSYAAQRP